MIWYLWRISDIKHATSAKLANKKKDSLPNKVGIFQNTVVLAVKIYEMFVLKENSPRFLRFVRGRNLSIGKLRGWTFGVFFLQKPQGGGNFTFLVKLTEEWYVFSWWNFNPPMKCPFFSMMKDDFSMPFFRSFEVDVSAKTAWLQTGFEFPLTDMKQIKQGENPKFYLWVREVGFVYNVII